MAYTLIATQTLTTATASVTFSGIPGTYKDLVLEVITAVSSGTADLQVQLNGDSGANYSVTIVYGNGSSAGSGRASNATKIVGLNLTTTLAISQASFMSYANANVYKTVLVRRSSTGTDAIVSADVNLWRSTSAITSIVLTSSASTLVAGSTFKLWGVS